MTSDTGMTDHMFETSPGDDDFGIVALNIQRVRFFVVVVVVVVIVVVVVLFCFFGFFFFCFVFFFVSLLVA